MFRSILRILGFRKGGNDSPVARGGSDKPGHGMDNSDIAVVFCYRHKPDRDIAYSALPDDYKGIVELRIARADTIYPHWIVGSSRHHEVLRKALTQKGRRTWDESEYPEYGQGIVAQSITVDGDPVAGVAPISSNSSDLPVNSIGITLVDIPPGLFLMGSALTSAEICDRYQSEYAKKWGLIHYHDECPPHEVTLSRGFMMGVHQVTQAQWTEAMGTAPWENESQAKSNPIHAANFIGWDDAISFCKKLSQLEGKVCRLPTEAEWEYACRAGTTTPFHFGDDGSEIGDYAWCGDNTFEIDNDYPHPVGVKLANKWGLHDMHGNVSEWCSDWYDPTYYSPANATDPTGPNNGEYHVSRGGCFGSDMSSLRSSYRVDNKHAGDKGLRSCGFRIVLNLP